ncbi:hypothetical protein TPB0596_00490 [Tsukamurella pulmonis]|uniref:helix-turn-helix domain-containing protein n=1 Tax=Tsukamurella pulmonis TaxID=47312 RepID=UPI001EDF2EC4|nr:helix-turn-helix domain-containing protein [Tsukamurella pulmonis]BDD80286.1 hypothetical protein TPB0596_00490 [Tsukamurella pulmonis]
MTTTTNRRIGTAAAAGILGVTDETVRAEIRRGHLPAILVGRCLRVLESDLDAYIAASTVGMPRERSPLQVTACETEGGVEVHVTGRTGSGKSSLVRELRRLWGDAVTGHRYGEGSEVLRLSTAAVDPSIAEVVEHGGLPERFQAPAA